jgi:predicted DsbA family dithiol-disulfide isomerase
MICRTAANLHPPIQLEVFFDLSCPFSLLGKVALDRILNETIVPIDLTWSPLILHPSVPKEGLDLQAAHAQHYGERSRPLQLQVERMAADLGLIFDHRRIGKVPNTLDAHRTVRFAAEAGRTTEMIDAILRGYFLDYRDIGDRDDLAHIVSSLGLNVSDFRARIASDWQREEVLAASRESAKRGIRSVPSYRLDGSHVEKTADLLPELRRLAAG